MNKKIIIKLLKGTEDIPVYKEIHLDNNDSILIEVTENTFGGDTDKGEPEPKVFFCYQGKSENRLFRMNLYVLAIRLHRVACPAWC